MHDSEFRPVSTHALVATMCLLALGLITVISIVSTIAEIGLLQQIASGAVISDAETARNDSRQALFGYLFIAALVVAAIAFLAWLNRASDNLKALGVEDQCFSPGWAVGGWFIPIFWLWRPYQVVKEIWQGSYPVMGDAIAFGWQYAPVSRLLGFWWGTWLVSNWLSNLVARIFFSSNATVDDLIRADWLSVFSDCISLAALAMVLILVRQITSNQARKHSVLRDSIHQEPGGGPNLRLEGGPDN